MAMGAARPCRRSRRSVPARCVSGCGAEFCGVRAIGSPQRFIPRDARTGQQVRCRESALLRMRSARPSWALMQRRRIELVLDALEMIKPLDRVVELGAFLFQNLALNA